MPVNSLEAQEAEIAALRRRVDELQLVVSKNEQAREELHAARQMMQLIIDNLPQAIFWKNSDRIYQGCNLSFAQDAGVQSPEHIAGKTDYDLAWKREEADFFREVDQRVMDQGIPQYHILEPQFQADGKQAWLDTNKIPLRDASGAVVGILGTYEDITERKLAEEHLQLYTDIVRHIQVGLHVYHLEDLDDDRTLRMIATNPAAEILTGVAMDDVLGKTFDENFPELRDKGVPQLYAEVVRTGKAVDMEYIHYGDDGVILGAFVVKAFPLPNHCVGTAFESITERKRTEEINQRLGRILDNTSNEIYVFHAETLRHIQVNASACRNLGYSPEELARMTALELQLELSAETFQELATPLRTGQQSMILFESVYRRKDGSSYPVEVHLHLSQTENPPVFVAIVQDMSERKRAEAERLRLQEEIIRTQETALRELSTPLIPLNQHVVVMPLIGAMDSRRAQQVMDTLLHGIAENHTHVAILDITGVSVVDTQVADALIRAAQAVRLLGAQVVLTGIRPEVAQALVGLGADLGHIVTCGSLQDGISYALQARQARRL